MKFLSSKPAAWSAVTVLSMLIAWLDWLTGHELSLFIFYFIPVGLSAWYLGLVATWVNAIVCGALWFLADFAAGHLYTSPMYSVWNTLIRTIAFAALGWSIARIRGLLILERETAEALRRSAAEVKILEGLLPICAQCKKIRDKDGQWQQLESYITVHTNAAFTHGLCQDCAKALLEDAGICHPREK